MKDIWKTMRERHSVRKYLKKSIPQEIRDELNACIAELNGKSGLHIQAIYDEPDCFDSPKAQRFENCGDYFSLVGKKSPDLDEKCGYYGELLVLKAQELGLNTCWAALTHGKSKAKIDRDEKESIVISLGYGQTPGVERRSKTPDEVSDCTEDSPEWYKRGIAAALLAPTAINQQKFTFSRDGNKVSVKTGKIGPCLEIDLGIVKCHFEIGAGKENFEWA